MKKVASGTVGGGFFRESRGIRFRGKKRDGKLLLGGKRKLRAEGSLIWGKAAAEESKKLVKGRKNRDEGRRRGNSSMLHTKA